MKIAKFIAAIVGFLVWNIIFEKSALDDNTLSDLVTFLSITIGFSITALSIIATSKFSRELYLIEDSSNNSQTLLHKLVSKFKFSVLLFTTIIGLIFIHHFLPNSDTSNFSSMIEKVRDCLKSVISYSALLAFFEFFLLIGIFMKFIIKSGTHQ